MICRTMQWLYNSGPAIAEWLPLVALGAYLLFLFWGVDSEDTVLVALCSPVVTVAFCGVLLLPLAIQDERQFSIDPGIYGYSYRDRHVFCCGCK